ncbi:MAG: hypothetical protein LBU47_07310 [Christensenellaceae bacterium]|nr:hypothetical protein [Christensenellaceae bacterium]
MHHELNPKISLAYLLHRGDLLRRQLENAMQREELDLAVELNRHLDQTHRLLRELGFTPNSDPSDEFYRVLRANLLGDRQT